ncbi:MAG: HYR domain-containing protein [Lewinellaceae bacterium]|nr:HYR domain-containing protein [Lewinellaceae bacterium]
MLVTITVTDAAGNSATCDVLVKVIDNTPPSAVCQDITLQLDLTGSVFISADDVDGGSSDNCGLSSLSISQTNFTCQNLGQNTVILTVTDDAGNTNTCEATVTVEDNIDPILDCPAPVTLSADADCEAQIPDFAGALSTNNCNNATITQVPAAGTIITVGTTTVTVTATDGAGNTATCTTTVTVEDTTPPTFTCPANVTVAANANCMGSVPNLVVLVNNESDNCTANPAVTQSIAAGTLINSDVLVTITVTDAAGNSATCDVLVKVIDNTPPSAVCQDITLQLDLTGSVFISADDVDGGSSDNCGLSSLSISQTNFTCQNLGPNTVILTVTDDAGNTNTCEATVTVEDNIDPILDCPAPVTLSADADCEAQIPDFAGALSTNNCNNATITQVPAAGTIITVGTTTVTVTATDGAGNTATCTTTVTVEDTTAPTFTCPANVTVAANANCMGSIPNLVVLVNNESDNCTANPTVTQSIAAGTLINSDVLVTITVTDGAGNSATCDVLVKVIDNTPPSAVCQNITLQLDLTGSVFISADDVDGGSSDNCGLSSLSISQTNFTCQNLGPNTVILTVTDDAGNTNTCEATVTIEDNIDPILDCPAPVTLSADADCEAQIPDFAGALSTNNCNNATITQVPAAGTIITVGTTTVTVTATDNSGNTATCTTTVTVEDTTAPTFTCPANVTVAANANCMGSIPNLVVLVNNESDNCTANPTVTQSIAAGTLINSDVLVTITVTDGAGNSATCDVLVKVIDNTPPSAVCQDITLQLDLTGSVFISADDVDGGSSDNCGLSSLSISQTNFTCQNLGPNTVILTVTDDAGNTNTCEATVTIEDNIDPILDCPAPVTLSADADCEAQIPDFAGALSTNNCNNATITQVPAAGTIITVGTTTVTVTATDNSGNTASCTTTVTVEDTTAPTFTCPANVTVAANANCMGSVPNLVVLVNNESDNCTANPAVTQSIAAGTLINSDVLVTITVTDGAGNSATCDVLVKVIDNTPPSAVCQDITLQLDLTGSVFISADDVDGGSSDNCGLSSLSISQTNFTCQNLGQNTVILTVTDDAGNTNTCEATVTIEDNIDPILDCPAPVTLSADADCEAQIPDFAGALSTVNCGPVTVTQVPAAGTIITVGTTTVTVTATDNSGNSASCTTTVTVEDTTAPTFTCPANVTVAANANCMGSIPNLVVLVNNESDNCTANPAVTQSIAAGTLINSDVLVTITVTDAAGNSATCDVLVKVIDNTPPSAVCQDITLQLDLTGSVFISADDVDGGSSDNCGLSSLSISQTNFTCQNLGPNTVILTVTDDAGNTNTCEATVTIEDNIDPILDCPAPVTLSADADCEAQIPDFAGALSTNNCNNATITQVPAAGTIITVGTTTVTVTATDNSGNSASCTTTVTVEDTTAPTFTCPANVTVAANANCMGSIPNLVVLVNNESDNCTANPAVTQSIAAGTLINSDVLVTITVTDAAGNSATCDVLVKVIDNTPPSAVCQDITLQLDLTGSVFISADDVDGGSSDNCGLSSLSISQTNFTCQNLGQNTVILTVTDDAGNTNTCEATVTIEDNIDPILDCPAPVILSADADCEAQIPDFAGALSTNNCNNATITQVPPQARSSRSARRRSR